MIKKIKKNLPLIIIIIYALIVSFHYSPITNDDVVFAGLKGNIFQVLSERYYQWTSRIIIEFFLIEILRNASILWNIFNSFIILLLYYSIRKITNKKKKKYIDYIIILLITMYSYIEMESAGWAATTINYLWVTALGIFSMIPIINEINNKKYNKSIYLLTIPALLFATNHEQGSVLIFGFSLVLGIHYYLKNKKINIPILIYFIISIIGIIFALTCPGNKSRLAFETLAWFNDYNKLGIIDKILLSLNNTLDIFLSKLNYIIISLYTILSYLFYKKKKRNLFIIGIILTLGTIIIPHLNIFNLNTLYGGHSAPDDVIPLLNLNSTSYIISIIISFIYIIITPILLYCVVQEKKDIKLFLPIMFIAAILSRMIIGFSPSIFASKYRTGIFLNYIILMIVPLILSNSKLNKKDKKNILIITIIIFLFRLISKFLNY